jgi:hypothetical protein
LALADGILPLPLLVDLVAAARLEGRYTQEWGAT